ncbi:MAG TPA: pyruvate dehydrogenase complex dihydrolipoamide acetyltransferase [Micropepsaceae bacterium]|nr:pyruvate dehydrogenase complex dihydrolipoamide acetyltransferase [Micropepsaceae bacterium]
MPPDILMPALSPTMEEGKLAKWHVKEGDTVKPGDILAEIETDKATMEYEAVDEGKIGKLLVPEGAEGVKVNSPIAQLIAEDSDNSAVPAAKRAAAVPEQKAKPAPAPQPAKTAGKSGNGASAPQADSRVFASPLAKRIAEGKGINLSHISGTGPRGRIIKADVEAAIGGGAPAQHVPAARPAAPATAPPVSEAPGASPAGLALPDASRFYQDGEYEAVPNDSMRKAIARRLTSAKALVPHYYLTIECDIGALMQARARLNERSPKADGAYKLSVNDFVVKAAAQALLKHPDVNASWTDAAVLRHKHADIGIAVDLNPGLITPILFQAETKGLIELSGEMKSLAQRAKAKKLKPQEYEGGSFAISNLGMFGVREFTAIINPPHSAILAVGAAEERAVVRDGKITAASVMSITMSCDHRVIDGAMGARFLQTLRAYLEEPAAMLL